ncbi:MAG: DinB family protein [Chloroflexi bacterium]|nr:MAG: DinB family protein [Chloroflexota bacterium]
MTSDPIQLLIEQLEEERAHLRLVLEQVPGGAIAQRPAGGAWSIIENVRHLLFAEQLHLVRPFDKQLEWSPLGYDPDGMQEARKLPPITTTPSLEDVLTAWDEIHPATIALLERTEADVAQAALERNLKHLRAHLKVIERLARNAES